MPAHTTNSRIDLDSLLGHVLLDCSLFRWFALRGKRKDAALNAIRLHRGERGLLKPDDFERALLDFLESWIEREGGGQ
jgi:hypothetical protein